VVKQIERIESASDYFEQQVQFVNYPYEDILLIHDPRRSYGEKIVWCSTGEDYERELARINGLRRAITSEYEQWWIGGGRGKWHPGLPLPKGLRPMARTVSSTSTHCPSRDQSLGKGDSHSQETIVQPLASPVELNASTHSQD